MDMQQLLNWRYATKKMDPAKMVSEEKVNRILEAIRLAPSSSGLQPYEVIVITNPELRAGSDKYPGTSRRSLTVHIYWSLPRGITTPRNALT